MPALVADDTLPAPQTSYGVQKLVCEHLIADYTRKGFIDGRAARLMTVTVRPGKPNGAASSFFSGIIREPLAGVPGHLPGRRTGVAPVGLAGKHGGRADRGVRGHPEHWAGGWR
jgi:nucleoside-diphosphate-sugar epimerase